MTSFSERIGKRAPKTLIQTEELDTETRTALWNVFHLHAKKMFDAAPLVAHGRDGTEQRVMQALWANHFHFAVDEMENTGQVWRLVKTRIEEATWFDVLELIEAFVQNLHSSRSIFLLELPSLLVDELNKVFERELVGYRFVGTTLTATTDQSDVRAIEEASKQAQSYPGAHYHLERATEIFADRHNPDYASVITQCVSAVESALKVITDTKKDLRKGLHSLDKVGLEIHPALKDAWEKMYAWASDDDGLRHGGSKAPQVDQSLAKYMLVSSSAFVSYLIEEHAKKNPIPDNQNGNNPK